MSAVDEDEGRCLTTEGVHEFTGIKVGTLRAWRAKTARTGEPVGPPSFRVEGVVLYRMASLRTWLAEREAAERVAS